MRGDSLCGLETGDWTDCLGKYFLDKRYSIVHCLVVVVVVVEVYGHLVLRIYCYLEHNFTRKMLQHCSGDLHTWRKLDSNSNVYQGPPDHVNTFLSAETSGNETK